MQMLCHNKPFILGCQHVSVAVHLSIREYIVMLINTEGRPAVLVPVIECEVDSAMWDHCFGNGMVPDNKLNRAVVDTILAAHNIEAVYTQPLRRKGK